MTDGIQGRADGEGRVYQALGDLHITENHLQGPEWHVPDSVRRPAVARPPVVMRDRTSLMERLQAATAPGAGGQLYVLHGLGGSGKTAVAYTLFEYATGESNRVGLWVNCSGQTTLRAGMLAVAADRGASEGELNAARSGLRAAADLVWGYLEQSAEPWLLVLDNADDPSLLRDGGWLRTSPRGTVLVTTRQAAAHWWPAAELLHLDVLPRTEAAQVLRDLAPDAGTEEEAAEVADRLGRLPLALTLAGGFLSHQLLSPWSLSDYGRHFDGTGALAPIQLLDQGAGDDRSDQRRLISRTWQLSLDALVQQGVTEAVHLLRLLACWSSDPLPLSLLAGAGGTPELPTHRVEIALRALIDHSLTSLVTEGGIRSLRTHGLLLESVAHSTPPEEHAKLAATAARLLLTVLPETPHRGRLDERVRTLAPHCHMLLRRAMACAGADRETLEAAAECVLRTVVALHRSGDYKSALSLATTAVEITEPSLGAADALVLELRLRVGRATFRLGHHEESEAILQQVLADSERQYGPDALLTMESCMALAHSVLVQGRPTEAVALSRRARDGFTQLLGPHHPRTLLARAYLLEVEPGPELDHEVGQAETLVAECAEALGADHHVTLIAKLNYAYALFYTGDADRAAPYNRSAVEGLKRRCGPDYPVTLAARDLGATILHSTGETTAAVREMKSVIEARTRVLGPEHPWTLAAQERLREFGASTGPGT